MTANGLCEHLHWESLATFEMRNMTLLADSLTYGGLDRVLPILPDEQPIICDFLKLKGTEKIIDAGTGSGILALYATSCGCDVIGIDIVPRAVSVAKENARRNGLKVTLKCERYWLNSTMLKSVNVVVFNPPHHPTPPGIRVAVHADGGPDGTSVFREFLSISAQHIVSGGRIVFFQLTPSRSGLPKIFEHVERLFPNGYTLRFARVLPTASNEWFLNAIYQGRCLGWIKTMSSAYPELDLIIGEFIEGGRLGITEIDLDRKVTTNWDDKVKLHKAILASVPNTVLQAPRDSAIADRDQS